MSHESGPSGPRLPIKIDSTSNGEFAPIPLTKRCAIGNRHALEKATVSAKRMGIGRRAFLMSSCGVASTLLAFNEVNKAFGRTGAAFAVQEDAVADMDAAAESVEGGEFIFDVQGHYVNPEGAWLEYMKENMPAGARPFSNMLRGRAPQEELEAEGFGYLKYLNHEAFIKDVFLDSDTDMMVLSFVPSPGDREPVTIESADATRKIVAGMEGSHRLLLHGRVNPNQAGDMDRMPELAERWGISAWKTYTQYGPGEERRGYFLDDDVGIEFIERAIATSGWGAGCATGVGERVVVGEAVVAGRQRIVLIAVAIVVDLVAID
ncbi:MAG: hypothetical protein ABFS30_16440, partial [Pseudomonadota bacterium]